MPVPRRERVREVPVTVEGDVAAATAQWLRDELRGLRTLAEVLAWTRRQRPPMMVTEIVTQDEYTHDVLVALAPRAYLVFDTT